MLAARLLRPRALEPTVSRICATQHQPTTMATATRSFASQQGYGDAGSDYQGKNPTEAGVRERIDTEHPGPEPVDEGKGTGSGGYAETGRPSSGSDSGSNNATAGARGKPQPKILNQKQPNGTGNADVDQHNREAGERYDRNKNGGDTVGKGFWSGQGGRDRQP